MTARRSGRLIWLLAAAMAWRVALAGAAWAHPDRLLTEEDSGEYLQIARNLLAGHGFSQAARPPYVADVRRTPVYPAFLALVFALPGSGARSAAAAGAIVSVLTVAATFRLVQLLAGSSAAWWAAVLLSLDLTTATYATQLLTEPLFSLLLVLSFLPLLAGKRASPRAGLAAGAVSGLAALCRPIGVLAFAALAPACALRRSLRQATVLLVAVSIAAVVVIGGWGIRNYRRAGTATVSSVAATNMYFHRAAYVEAWLEHRRVEDLRDEWERDFATKSRMWSEDERVQWMNEHGRGLVLKHPLVYAIVAVRGAARMLAPDHIVLASLVGGEGTPAFRVLYALGWIQLVVIYALAAMAVIRVRPSTALALAVPLAPIAYFLLIGGPEMYPRFRVPIMPFVCALAAGALTVDHRA